MDPRCRKSQHPVLHSCLQLVHLGVLLKLESPQELAPDPLHPMPLDSSFVNLHLHVHFIHPWKISFDDVGFWSLLPVDSNVCKSRSLISRWTEDLPGIHDLQRIPDVKRHGIHDVASSTAEERRDDRHSSSVFRTENE
ncbi:hypothetical protein CKAN_01826500 [Cinnamomum micranthum f. kanehirae]|uniref:Uncharacterized protein n=1 Tax=Cinnamomum micranthum f. kanehirae TaxID=337451 RepID=A0A443PEK2_9MAGN|nr:hypothetical protein CKAN_01826500 [Cinnamomum micranthum f. kanehirae]